MSDSATLAAFAFGRLRRIGRAIVDGVLPPRCLACGEIVEDPHALCGRCWSGITFFAPPWCVICGRPFPHPVGEDALCGSCARVPPAWDQARAVLRYDKSSRGLVLGLKHGDRTHAAAAFGRWMHHAGGEVLAGVDLLVPVPLHWTRLWQRRFNQSAALAQAISRQSGVPAADHLLARARATPPQFGLARNERARNVQGALEVSKAARIEVGNKKLVLIDDVLTTGATADACVKALLRAGAARVDVLVLARVVEPF
jgi:ComF family protein